jgi:hypothetical protein
VQYKNSNSPSAEKRDLLGFMKAMQTNKILCTDHNLTIWKEKNENRTKSLAENNTASFKKSVFTELSLFPHKKLKRGKIHSLILLL